VGKTTFLAHLLKARLDGGSLCGRKVTPGRALYVSEEPKKVWIKRRDAPGLTDSVHVLIKPF
jgi:hypothetical protein